VVADDQVQMAAVDAAQAVERVFDGAAVGEVAENPELVVAPDELVDVADDGVPMACDVADCFERRLIVAYVLFDSRVSGGASLRLPDITVFGAEPAIVQESAQCGDQRVAEMRVRSEIAHVVPYGMRLLDAFINDRANITRKAFPKMLVGLFVALFGDYGEYERWNSNAHTSGFGVRLPRIKQLAKIGRLDLSGR
jgi:hypothetical protein